MNKTRRSFEFLFSPVSSINLSLFRVIFGIILFIQSTIFFNQTYITKNFILPDFQFTYAIFDWLNLKPWSPPGMFFQFKLMALSSVFIALGLFTRFSLATYLVSFFYIFTLEKNIYYNLYYLLLLVSFLMLISDCSHRFALDNLIRKNRPAPFIPYWQLFLLRFQFAIVYFFGGISKINYDWLIRAQPLHTTLSSSNPLPIPFTDEFWFALLLSWGACILDLLIGAFLLLGKYKRFTLSCILLFNFMTFSQFGGGLNTFPYLMTTCFILFIEPNTLEKFVQKFFPKISAQVTTPPIQKRSAFALWFIICYVALQSFIPLRHFLYPGDASWTGEGDRFSWRMRLNWKDTIFRINITDKESNEKFSHVIPKYMQTYSMILVTEPDALIQYAHYLKSQLVARKIVSNPVITIDAFLSLNIRPYQRIFDKNVNLAEIEYPPLSHATWILPFNPNMTLQESILELQSNDTE